jgi:hypothetical protein
MHRITHLLSPSAPRLLRAPLVPALILLATVLAAAALARRDDLQSYLPIAAVAVFYFALYRGGQVLGRTGQADAPVPAEVPEPAAVAPVPQVPAAAPPAVRAAVRPKAEALRQVALAAARPAQPVAADAFDRLARMAAAERRRETTRAMRSPG